MKLFASTYNRSYKSKNSFWKILPNLVLRERHKLQKPAERRTVEQNAIPEK